MRTSTLAMVVALGSVIAPPVLAPCRTHRCRRTRASRPASPVSQVMSASRKSRALLPVLLDRPATARRRRARPVERALRRLERARNLAKHELEKRVPVFVFDKCEAWSRGPCERTYRVGVGPVGDCGK